MTAQELTSDCTVVLSSGTYKVEWVEQSDLIENNVLVHHSGGTYECAKNALFRHIRPLVFTPVVSFLRKKS